MFLFIPHSSEFNLKRIPYVTYLIVLICIVVFYFQYQNKQKLAVDSTTFCHAIAEQSSSMIQPDEMDKMRSDEFLCALMIKRLEQRPDLTITEIIGEYFWFKDHSDQQINAMADYIQGHYSEYKKHYTSYLNKELMYFPESPDLLKMFSSTVAHGDVWHIVGNLIFFLAFAPAIEILLARAWLFLAVVSVIAITTSLSYTASVYLGAQSLPGLGLSGVVMGMIGLYAALMPFQKIRVFVWVLTYVRNIFIPAWILALWYIGLDGVDLLLGTGNPAINLVAHVTGGITGYVLGLVFFKRYRDKVIQQPQ